MATILKAENRSFREDANKIEPFRTLTDLSRASSGIKPQWLNFDMKWLNPGEYSAPYHFHRYAEELFMIVSGSATLRTTDGLHEVGQGDLLFFEAGESGAHQLYNHTQEPCQYLDIRSYIGFDVCGYPDSDKLLIAPTFEVFRNGSTMNYFDGEHSVADKWAGLKAAKD